MKVVDSRKGIALLAVLVVTVLVTGIAYAMLACATSEHVAAEVTTERTQALYVAQAGIERAIKDIGGVSQRATMDAPFAVVDAMQGTLYQEEKLASGGRTLGRYTVEIVQVINRDRFTRDVRMESTGMVEVAGGDQVVRRIEAVVEFSLGRSHVFDYVYFINNWGWYFGNTIIANGNVRSNAQFDGGLNRAAVNGMPRFDGLDGTDLGESQDAGGLFAGWNIVRTQHMRGMVSEQYTQEDVDSGDATADQIGEYKNQHAFAGVIPMPDLTDLSLYEEMAGSHDSSITVDGVTVCDGVMGDDPGEQTNLYLYGTDEAPIVINGPVVVRGNVAIYGKVAGQGSIYAQGNVYIPGNITYVDPLTPLPEEQTEGSMAAWIAENGSKPALGLFAREHVVAGDYGDNSWRNYVSRWVDDYRNESDEDSGEDQLPNTRAGRDGIMGTEDDDILEGDGVFTIEHYTQDDYERGIIPYEMIGGPIPGTGEDIDGDGVYDPRTEMSEFYLSDTNLQSSDWGGNLPQGGVDYLSVTTDTITQIDAAIYTNHAIAMLTRARARDMVFNGCIVSRNEAIIYGTDRLVMNYDPRLLNASENFSLFLPRAWDSPSVVYWNSN